MRAVVMNNPLPQLVLKDALIFHRRFVLALALHALLPAIAANLGSCSNLLEIMTLSYDVGY